MSQPPFSFVGRLDTSPLKEKLVSTPQLFGLHTWRSDVYAHSDMKDIWVRYNAESKIGARFNDMHYPEWYPCYWKHLKPMVDLVVQPLMAAVQGESLGGVLITKLPPGACVKRHIDKGWHAQFYEKFYVAVKNAPGAVFGFEGGDIAPNEGDVYCFNNGIPHWVNNFSTEDRISMIVCIRTNQQNREYGSNYGFCVDKYSLV